MNINLKNKIIAAISVLIMVLAVICGCKASSVKDTYASPLPSSRPVFTVSASPSDCPQAEVKSENPVKKSVKAQPIQAVNMPQPTAAPSVCPTDTEPQAEEILTCSLSVKCTSVFDNLEKLKPEKIKIIPENGIIFDKTDVVFYDGDSVFDVLLREMRKNNIHMEFVNTPAYKTAYIEGINNLYEFDCGEQSGWMYLVNGQLPGCGCSSYILKPHDRIDFLYSCKTGADIVNSSIGD